MNDNSTFVLRRLTEPFSEWAVALPVLFALGTLFVIACLRQEKGIGTLLLGLCMLVVAPVLMAYDHKAHGGPYFVEALLKYGLVGVVVLGFTQNLLREFSLDPVLSWIGAGLCTLMHMGWVFLEPSMKDTLRLKEPLPLLLAPYVLAFLVQCVLSSIRGGVAVGLIVVFVLSVVYAPFAVYLHPFPLISWWVVLVPMLAGALFYVVMMYIHDSRTIHWAWSLFLGLLRCCVYAILTVVFLLPGMQFLETSEIQPKILILLDVSDSMNHKDELAPAGGAPDNRLTRQQQIVAFITAEGEGEGKKKAWIRRILEKTPATVYRFGKRLDESSVEQLPRIKDPEELTAEEKEKLTAQYWNRFLHLDVKQVKDEVLARSDMKKIAAEIESLQKKLEKDQTAEDKKSYGERLEDLKRQQSDEILRREEVVRELLNGTDVPGSVNRASDLEKSNYVQAIIVVSDGRSNYTGAENALSELLARVNNGERKVPVFTVGVGDYKQPAEILAIDDMKAPSTARPDEKFLVQVPVKGTLPLRGADSQLYLEARRTRDAQTVSLVPNWWARRMAPSYAFPVRKGAFVEYSNFTWLEDYDVKEKALRPVPPMTFEIDLVRIFQECEPKLVGDFLKVPGDVKFNEETFKTLKAQELDFMRFALEHKGGVNIGKAIEKFEKRGLDAAKIQVEFKTMFMEKFIEGEWEFGARVPRNKDEEYDEDWHVSRPPARVQVRDKKPRILLVGGGPTREYQFVRTLLAREAQQKRLELSIYLQSGAQEEGIDQDVPPDRLLSHFPHRRGPEVVSTDKYSSINSYDLIIAVDPDWGALNVNLPDQPSDPEKRIRNRDQAKLISNWVLREGGGIIFVTGPMNGYALSIRPKDDATDSVGDLPDLVPVVLADSRTQEDLEMDLKRPFALTFTKDARKNDFLNLDADPKADMPDDLKNLSDSPPGWDAFFWGKGQKGRPGAQPVFGFYSFYPVLSLRNDTTVLATFNGPRPKKTDIKGEQPWLAAMRAGSGKTLYIGSPETWRLRQYKESFHETFWLNAIRFATSGSQQREKFGGFLASRKTPVGSFAFDVQIKEAVRIKVGDDRDEDKKPKKGEGNEAIVPGDWHPRVGPYRQKVYLRKRGELKDGEPFDLRPKATDGPWQGWFEGNVKLKEEGEYELVVKIYATKENNPETTEVLIHQLEVFRPRLEDENLKEDFTAATGLKALASDAESTAERMKGELDPYLELREDKGSAEGRRLFFVLKKGTIVPECLLKIESLKTKRVAGIRDIWDLGMGVPLFHLLWSVPLALFLLFGSISMYHQKWVMGSVLMVLAVIVPLTVAAIPWLGDATGWYSEPQWSMKTVDVAFVLATVVSLLALEWLTRKLLKLA